MTAESPIPPAPTLPVPLTELVKHLDSHRETPVAELMAPFRQHEAHLRALFAQDPSNPKLQDRYVNVLPIFTADTPRIRIRARNLSQETKEEKEKYIMPLPAKLRKKDGSPAVVGSLKEFQKNFDIFSEQSLADMDWYVLSD